MATIGEQPTRSRIRTVAVVLASVFVVVFVFRMTEAGSLSPSALPASTLRTLEEIFNPLAGTYDSSSDAAYKNGNVMEMTKCIIARMKGHAPSTGCPTNVFQLTPVPIARSGLAVALRNPTGNAFIRWIDAGITWTRTALSFKLNFDTEPEVEGSDTGVSLSVGCADVGVKLIDVWTCNGSSHCDFAQTFVDTQDAIGACPGPLGGSFPMVVGNSAISVNLDATKTASVSWSDMVLNTAGTISNYKARKGVDPFVTSANPDVVLQFNCTDFLSTPITTEWHACDGTDCNWITTSVDVQDNLAVCP